jgi:activating signal cointegrator 1
MSKPIPTLSLWQPWGSLIAHGFKRFETRSFKPPQYLVGALLAIHAAKRWTADEARQMKTFVLTYPAVRAKLSPDGLLRPPLGAILCVCRLVDYHPTELIRSSLSDQERAFGNYDDGRFAWELEVLKVPPAPIPAKGAQGIWKWIPGQS